MLLRLCLCSTIAVLTLNAQAGGRGGSAVFGGPQSARQAGPQSGPPPPPPPSDCAVSGTVVNAMTGEPIPRAMVSLGGFDEAGSATDATGHWSISNTSCTGNRPVNATRIGFIDSQMSRNASGSRPTMVNLVSGSPVTGVKISLMPESSIAGKIQDPDGDPIESARIQVLHVQVQAGQRILAGTGGTVTDSQGNFRIGGLQPGGYVVCAGSPRLTYPVGGGPAMAYRDDCYPGPPASGISIAMPVESGREVRIALTLNPTPGVHVRGRVSGLPATVVRTDVQLIRVPNNGAVGRNLNAQLREDGSFDIATVSPGSYVATFNWRSNPPGAQPVTMLAPVEVGDSDVDNVLLTHRQAGTLSGTVRYQLSNPSTAANPPVTVNLRPGANDGRFVGGLPQPQWDADHLNFSFADVQPALQLRLNAFVNGPGVYIRSATLRGQDVLDQPFTVEGVAGPVDIVVSDDTGSIDVTVNDSDGHPAMDARVMLLPASGQPRFLTSGDDGHATQKNLPTGDYHAWAFDNLATVPYAEEEWMNQNAGPGEKVSVTSGGNATLTLKRQTAPKE